MENAELNCFKAYDVRGRIPDELNPGISYRIGRAYAAVVQPRSVMVGHDIRLSSAEICSALTRLPTMGSASFTLPPQQKSSLC